METIDFMAKEARARRTQELRELHRKVADLEAWQQVAVDANRAVDAYLREVDPDLPEHYGMPVDGVRQVIERLRHQ